MNEKSYEIFHKKSARRDILNSISPITIVGITVFIILMFLNTFGMVYDYDGVKMFEITRYITDSVLGETLFFAYNDYEGLFSLIPFVVGVLQFMFLSNKAHCNDILSLPLSRKTVFKNRFLFPLLIITGFTVIIKVAVILIYVKYDKFSVVYLMPWFTNVLGCIQSQFTAYSLGVVGCILCGKLTEAVLFGAAIPIVPYFVLYAISEIIPITLRGYDITGSENRLYNFFINESMVAIETGARYDTTGYVEYREWYVSVIWLILSVIAVLAIRHYFVNHFKPENSGIKVANNKNFVFICFSAAFLGIYTVLAYNSMYSFFSYNFYAVGSKDAMLTIFICIIAAIVLSVLVGIALSFNPQKLKIALLGGLVAAGIIVITTVLCLTDVFGIYNILPKAEDITSVTVTLPFDEYAIGKGEFKINFIEQESRFEDSVQFDSYDDIRACLDINKKLSKNKTKETLYNTTFTYHLNNGKTVTRYYRLITKEATDELIKLWSSDSVKQLCKNRLDGAVCNFENSQISIFSKQNIETDIKPLITQAQLEELKIAIYEDVKILTADEWFNGDVDCLGVINIIQKGNYDPFNNSFMQDEFTENTGIPVRANMTKTISVLKKYNLYEYLFTEAKIECAYIFDYEDINKYIKEIYLLDDSSVSVYYLPNALTHYINGLKSDGLQNGEKITAITDKREIKNLLAGARMHCVVNSVDKFIVIQFEKDATNNYSEHFAVYALKNNQ